MRTETDILNLIRLALSEKGIINFRNNVGALKDINGRLVKYGLCTGSSDIIAIRPVVITPEMVGSAIGQFVAIEVKQQGEKPNDAQERFLEIIRKHGGLAGVARSVEELDHLLRSKE